MLELSGSDGYKWGITFAVTDTRLSWEERSMLITEATQMYLTEEKKRDVKSESYEGQIWTNNKYYSLGSYGGQLFSAVVDTNQGTAKLEFLVCELTRAFDYSRN